MNIVYWSDFACPYCYIGETRLKKAIKRLEEAGEIKPGEGTLEMKAFQLEPYAGEHADETSLTRLMNKYKLSKKDARERLSSITEMGLGEGLEFDYENARNTNTMDAHRLTKLAQSKSSGCVAGCQIDSGMTAGFGDPSLADKVIEALFHAYIAEGKELADKSVLLEIAEKCGMDTDEVSAMLNSGDLRGKVVLEEKAAAANGIHVVPTFFIGDYMIPGVIEVEEFEDAVRKAVKE